MEDIAEHEAGATRLGVVAIAEEDVDAHSVDDGADAATLSAVTGEVTLAIAHLEEAANRGEDEGDALVLLLLLLTTGASRGCCLSCSCWTWSVRWWICGQIDCVGSMPWYRGARPLRRSNRRILLMRRATCSRWHSI